jgi:probable HAF family extracellular repeat protein
VPSSGVTVLSCFRGGGFTTTFAGRDAPAGLISAHGDTIAINICAFTVTGCHTVVARWTPATGPTVVNLGWAYAISADGGTILIDRGDGSTGSSRPAIWRDGNFIDLGLDGAYARLLSADGTVVAARVDTGVGVTQAVLRPISGAVKMLGDFPGGPEYSEPNAINGDGSVVVGYGNVADGQAPFVWTSGSGQMVNLGAVGPVNQTVALATSADGTAVAGTSLADSGTAIFRWTPSGGMKAIGYRFDNRPGSSVGLISWTPPLLISGDGAVVTGTEANPTNRNLPIAVRWTAAGGLVALTAEVDSSIIRDASQDGSRIVGARVQTPGTPGTPPDPGRPATFTPFVWDAAQGTRDLGTALAAAGIDLGGLTLGDPIAISADGTTLVGHAACGADDVVYRVAYP